MDIYIVRDAVEIGHFPRTDLEGMVRRGELFPTDYYWCEGMENWALLPKLLGADAWNPESWPVIDQTVEAPTVTEPAPTAEPVVNYEPEATIDPGARVDPVSAPEPIPPVASERDFVDPSQLAQPLTPSASTATPVAALFGRIRDRVATTSRPVLSIAICVAAIVLFLLVVSQTRTKKPRPAWTSLGAAKAPVEHPEVNDATLKRKAFDELKHRIDRLPITAVPPLNTIYYDFSLNMAPSGSTFFPWKATVHGGESVIDPGTQATTRRTEFNLFVEYRDNEWTFRRYEAREIDATNGDVTQISMDDKNPVPPGIVGVLGLKAGRD